jgi:hypothetical protein
MQNENELSSDFSGTSEDLSDSENFRLMRTDETTKISVLRRIKKESK